MSEMQETLMACTSYAEHQDDENADYRRMHRETKLRSNGWAKASHHRWLIDCVIRYGFDQYPWAVY